MPDLSELNLSEEATPAVDWDAPESGSFPPQVTPGTYTLLFRMPESEANWFDKQDVGLKHDNGPDKGKPVLVNGEQVKKAFLVIQPEFQVIGDKDGNPYTPEPGSELPVIRFQRFSFFKNDNMQISFGAELLRSIGIRISGAMTPQAIRDEVRKVNGQVTLKGEIAWETYFKSTETRVSTVARVKKGEIKWPRSADGSFDPMVSNPKNPNDQKQYGREKVIRVHAISAGAAA
jgi:hypothetical protein